ncbi:MAG TPA: hypothetical protein VKA08_10655 [Balneolales bacterium]|nr:hypothetical protein [Balneolales bacterium]
MKRCAFLTMDTLDGYVSDDELVYQPMRELGWHIDSVSWHRTGVDWSQYEAVLIRTTWDYHRNHEKFLATLNAVNRSGTRLLNPFELVRWNIHKTYLRDLECKGIRIVPALWPGKIDREQLYFAMDEFGAEEIVVKPVVSAGARNTFRIRYDNMESGVEEAVNLLAGKECMIQPFIHNIITEGEYSVFYFGGSYSHAVLKTPKQYDFRVQEEHGGILRSVVIPDPILLKRSQKVLDVLDRLPFYARVDWVRDTYEEYSLMELELIEPSLYFRTDPASPVRFAQAFDAWMGKSIDSYINVSGKG